MQVTPDDARLWCSLGDLTLEDSHFHTAWERSGRRSVRAQRSLARSAHRQQKYAEVRYAPHRSEPQAGKPSRPCITAIWDTALAPAVGRWGRDGELCSGSLSLVPVPAAICSEHWVAALAISPRSLSLMPVPAAAC